MPRSKKTRTRSTDRAASRQLRRLQQARMGVAAALRRTAVQAMRLLEEFNPRLVGSVLDGTAGPHTRVALHLFAESSETVILFFRDRGIPFSQEQRQIRWFNGEHRPIELIVTELDGRTLELAVFEPVHLRQAPPSPIDGKPQRRAALPEVELVLAEQDA
ncbi:MAG: hypothetical protein P8Y54_06300 [Xanthomonadales bacterium]